MPRYSRLAWQLSALLLACFTALAGSRCTSLGDVPAPGCVYTVSPTSASFDQHGGNGSVTVSTDSACTWQVQSGPSWLTIASATSGTGKGAVNYSVGPNTSTAARNASFSVGGQAVTISQAGTPAPPPPAPPTPAPPSPPKPSCDVTVAPTSVSLSTAEAASGSIAVRVATGCAWTASSSASWLQVTSGSTGTGNGSVGYSAAQNTALTARTATLTVAGIAVAVMQPGVPCSFTLDKTSESFGAAGGTGSVKVTTTAICPWTAASNVGWIQVTNGAAGTGSGTVSYHVDSNSAKKDRQGTLTIGGQDLTITEAGTGTGSH